MKKFIILASILTVFSILFFVVSVKAQGGDPLALIWDWIGRLRERVNILEEEVANIELIPGPEGPQGPPGPPGPAGQQLHLYDSSPRPQDLGIVLDASTSGTSFSVSTYLPSATLGIFIFRSFINDFSSATAYFTGFSSPNTFWYLQPNCVGDPYVYYNGYPYDLVQSPFPPPEYFQFTNEPPLTNQIILSLHGNSGAPCTNGTYNAPLAYRLEQVDLPFDLPLVWPLRIQ